MEEKSQSNTLSAGLFQSPGKKDGVPHVKVSYNSWGREYDECLRNAEFRNTENDVGFFKISRLNFPG